MFSKIVFLFFLLLFCTEIFHPEVELCDETTFFYFHITCTCSVDSCSQRRGRKSEDWIQKLKLCECLMVLMHAFM